MRHFAAVTGFRCSCMSPGVLSQPSSFPSIWPKMEVRGKLQSGSTERDLDGIRRCQSFPSWCVCGGRRVAYIKVAIQWDLIYTTDGRDYKVSHPPSRTTFESRLKTCDKLDSRILGYLKSKGEDRLHLWQRTWNKKCTTSLFWTCPYIRKLLCFSS